MLGLAGEKQGVTTTSYTRDNTGGLIGQRGATTRHYYLTDALGSVAAVTDQNGTVVASYDYSPFGEITSETGSLENPWRFIGAHNYYYDTQTKHYKVGIRYYDASLGRWTQRDPVHNALHPKSWNPYVHVGQDCINYTDPTGADFFDFLPEISAGLTCIEGGIVGFALAGPFGAVGGCLVNASVDIILYENLQDQLDADG